MKNKLIYTSDMHGNEAQFNAFVDYALQICPSIVIVGGELPPKGGFRIIGDYPQMQRTFLKDRLPNLLKPIKEKLPNTKIFVSPGNDDCAVNDDILNSHPDLFTNIDGKRVQLQSGLEIVGYSTVPITPFGIKDREKFDLTNIPANLIKEYTNRERECNLHGLRSVKGDKFGWRDFSFTEADRANSIQRDLESNLYTANPERTLYVFHTPPNNTALDIIENNIHVGSFAVRQFIESYQPLLTLHGHIHETVDMSGEYKTQIGKTWCMSVGNHNEGNKLAVLVLDLDNPANAERVGLPCTSLARFFRKLT